MLRGYRRPDPSGQPNYLEPRYVSTIYRAPTKPLIRLPHTLSEVTGPSFNSNDLSPFAFDLTKQSAFGSEAPPANQIAPLLAFKERLELQTGSQAPPGNQRGGTPIGERIVVSGSVRDEDGQPIENTLVEIWQANAAGRYCHPIDQHDAPLDKNFIGMGQALTDDEGRYRFITIRPGAYPWKNHPNAWRPAHIHFSIFGPAICTRLVTQMYFPGDPLLPFDPMFCSIPNQEARQRLISTLDWDSTIPEFAIGYRFDIILRGRDKTPSDAELLGTNL